MVLAGLWLGTCSPCSPSPAEEGREGGREGGREEALMGGPQYFRSCEKVAEKGASIRFVWETALMPPEVYQQSS